MGLLPLLLLAGAHAATPFTAEDLVRLERISDPQVSPDGRSVAYVQRSTDMSANRGRTDIFVVSLTEAGAVPRRLTTHPANDASPRWLPDSRRLVFLSDRSGSSQLWQLAIDGGEARQLSEYPLDVGTFRVAPDGRGIGLTMEVFPDCADLACSRKRLDQKPKASGLRFEQLFVRHWDRWEDGSFSHLFTVPLTEGRLGEPRDLMRGVRAHVPSRPFGGDEEYGFAADGSALLWSMRLADAQEPWSTNFDIYTAPVSGAQPPRNLTADNPAWDTQPRSLADGTVVWLAMSRAGFEADRYRIMVRTPTGQVRELAPDWDRSPDALSISVDGREILASAADQGRHALFAIALRDGKVRRLTDAGQVAGFSPTRGGAVIALADLNSPPELFELRGGGKPRQLTLANATLLGARTRAQYEQFSFAGAGGDTVYGHVMRPQGVPPGTRAPVAFIVHGGPQSNMGDDWSFRWNPKIFAAAGYAVVFIDFHGSTGYGQKFTDSISGDWGGKPLEDLQKGLTAALQRFDFLDGERVCALGASYGGFMMNWIAGHWPDRFKCLVNHAGIFDARAMYYTTEELWFEEWEYGGTAFEKPANYERFNPALAVDKWRTPTLVIHGQLDYRVPYSQGIATFTALQRRGIPSRLLVFPDENHWILKPENSLQWHTEVLGWLAQYLRPGTEGAR
jgi:dipeptidyl aminopeptidase/acylaminoacyl peptidase